MTDSFDKYCHLVAVMPPDTVRLVMDIIEVTPAQQPYETLKERLLSHFKLSKYERLEKLFTMPELSSRKPSAMLEVCPRGGRGDEDLPRAVSSPPAQRTQATAGSRGFVRSEAAGS
jgi:hypothetical protein